jgi:hypothetical protein
MEPTRTFVSSGVRDGGCEAGVRVCGPHIPQPCCAGIFEAVCCPYCGGIPAGCSAVGTFAIINIDCSCAFCYLPDALRGSVRKNLAWCCLAVLMTHWPRCRSPSELAGFQEKTFVIDDHIGISISGLTSDARSLCKCVFEFVCGCASTSPGPSALPTGTCAQKR